MIDVAINRLVQTTEAVGIATLAKAFEAAVQMFVEQLSTIPDYPASDASNHACDTLNSLAEQVIAHIERRLETTDEGTPSERLAASIYEIRRVLEEIFVWRRHYVPPAS